MDLTAYKTFESERLFMRPTNTEDSHFIYALMTSPKWFKFIGDRNLSGVQDAVNYISTKMFPQLLKLGFGNYTVIRKEDQEKLGTVGVYDREGLEGLDIGFAFLPEFEQKGYAIESAQALKEFIKTEFGITYLKGITNKENAASQKLLLKLGLSFQKNIILTEEADEVMLFSNQ